MQNAGTSKPSDRRGTSAIRMVGVTKTFGPVVANDNINLDIKYGEVLSLLGENGSGKTTLMNMLSGIYFPDAGEIQVNGQPVTIRSPKDAFDLKIGMIHQHFKLVDVFTASENIVLGLEEQGRYNKKEVARKVRAICDRYGFDIDPEQKVYTMSVSQKQTLEIVKVLYRGADILILDEPTAVLTLQEIDKLFAVIRNMRDDGKAVVIITHKLNEVLAVADEVAILRHGVYIGTVPTSEATESSLTEMMVGKKVALNIARDSTADRRKRLSVQNLTVVNEEGVTVLDNLNFDALSGEVLGIAGISGSGQKELLESIAGLQKTQPGSSIVYYNPHETEREEAEDKQQLIGKTPKQIREYGVHLSFVPEDRLGMGLVGSMGMTGNMMLKNYSDGKSLFLDRKQPRELAERILEELEVVTPGINTPVRRLSGGNVQKVLVGREIAAAPTVLMTAYAVRGLDINTSYTIYNLLNEQKKSGVAVIYVGEDLDVLLELCDRILVLCGGHVSGIVDARTTTKEAVGALMVKGKEAAKKEG